MDSKTSRPPQLQNQRQCFRVRVPVELAAAMVLDLPGGELRLPIVDLSVDTDGQGGGMLLGLTTYEVRRQIYLLSPGPFSAHIHLPGEPVQRADAIFIRWEEDPPRPALRYRMRDRRDQERMRRFWAACQRYYLVPI